jgi:hypothetical protein
MSETLVSTFNTEKEKQRTTFLFPKGLILPIPAAVLQLSRALLREGKQGYRHASRLASQTQATLRRASRLLLTSEAHKQELEEAKQVGVCSPFPLCPVSLLALSLLRETP